MDNLHPDHLADLRKSGLSDDTITAAGIYSVPPREIKKITQVSSVTSLCAFPYPGEPEFTRYKVFPVPLKTKDGKSFRYTQRKATGVHLYIPPAARAVLKDPDMPLGIVEGEKKALKGCQEGIACLAIGGLWNWLEDGRLLGQFDDIALQGRQVPIYPDSDVWKRPDLRLPVYRLGRALEARGAQVTVCILPNGPGETKLGLDDYLVHHAPDELRALAYVPLDDRLFADAQVKERERINLGRSQHGQRPDAENHGSASGAGTTSAHFPIVRGKEATPVSCQVNAEAWLRANPTYATQIWMDTFLHRMRVRGEDYSDDVLVKLVSELETDTCTPWCESHVHSAMVHLASQQAHSSLQAWLDGLTWDHTARLDSYFSDVCGAVDSAYTRACAKVMFLSAVARGYQPGCQADIMVVFIGNQGIGKSRAIAALSPDPSWYTDDISDLYERKAAEGLIGKWLVEFGEFARINRATVETVKSFISRTTDHYRPAYGRMAKDFPRQCIFVGTTNNRHPLTDVENRRFMPVWCPGMFIHLLPARRDQLWAEAVHRYKAGEPWWVTDHALIEETRAQQDEARHVDSWEEILSGKLRGHRSITMPEVLDILGIKPDRHDKSHQIRIGLALNTLGFHRKRVRQGAQLSYVYERTDD